MREADHRDRPLTVCEPEPIGEVLGCEVVDGIADAVITGVCRFDIENGIDVKSKASRFKGQSLSCQLEGPIYIRRSIRSPYTEQMVRDLPVLVLGAGRQGGKEQ